VRCGAHTREAAVVAHYDVLLRSDAFIESHPVELVVRVGDAPTSKPLREWLANRRQIVVDPYADWHEPTRAAETTIGSDPAVLCELVLELLHESRPKAATSGSEWRAADATVEEALAAVTDPFEPAIWNAVADSAPDGSTLWVASSMPVRDVESFLPVTEKPLRVLANRGANGIDGTVSSALGAALASEERVFLLVGDLALLHDLSGLVASRRLDAELTIVCANNAGGNIFDFLPVAAAAEAEAYEQHIVTPSGIDLADVATLAAVPHVLASTPDEVRAAVKRPGLVEVRTDRTRNVELHRELYERVAASLSQRAAPKPR
jgi:2-succinyl-5-enolpyruvyl-6-hydroxy-3-cyclohexene-1-carboxylate synthase